MRLDPARTPRGLSYVGFVEAIRERLEALLESEVDLVPEPAVKRRLQDEIDKDRIRLEDIVEQGVRIAEHIAGLDEVDFQRV